MVVDFFCFVFFIFPLYLLCTPVPLFNRTRVTTSKITPSGNVYTPAILHCTAEGTLSRRQMGRDGDGDGKGQLVLFLVPTEEEVELSSSGLLQNASPGRISAPRSWVLWITELGSCFAVSKACTKTRREKSMEWSESDRDWTRANGAL